MPTYEYKCQSCGHELETFQHFNDDPLKTCPNCNKDELARVISGGLASFVNSPRTLGSLAERNASRMSSELKERMREQQETRRDEVLYEQLPAGMERVEKPKGVKPPWYKTGQKVTNSQINRMTKAQKKKYVETGVTL